MILMNRPIEFIGSGTAYSADGTASGDLNVPISASTNVGDIVILIVRAEGAGVSYLPTGYTNILPVGSLNTGNSRFYAYYKTMVGTVDTVAVLDPVTDKTLLAITYTVRSCSQATVLDATTTTAIGTDQSPNPPSITPVTRGAQVISCGVATSETNGTGGDLTPPDYTENAVQFYPSVSKYTLFIGFYGQGWLNGAVDPGIWVPPVALQEWGVATFVLRPSP